MIILLGLYFAVLVQIYGYTDTASKGEDRAKPKLFLGFRAGRLNLAERPGRQGHYSHPPAHSVLAGTGRAPSTLGPPQREWIGRLDWLCTALLLDTIQLLALDQARYSVADCACTYSSRRMRLSKEDSIGPTRCRCWLLPSSKALKNAPLMCAARRSCAAGAEETIEATRNPNTY